MKITQKIKFISMALISIIPLGVNSDELDNVAVRNLAELESKATGYVENTATGVTKSFLEQYFPTVEVTLNLSNPNKPTSGILVVAPLSDPNDIENTIFTQLSAFHSDGNRTTLNAGIGYRKLTSDENLLLGINAFYDHEFPYDHGRTSIGLEARSSVGELNMNAYWGTTGWQSGENGFQEKGLDGMDAEIGIPLPYMNWAKFYGRIFTWDSEVSGVKDISGNDLSLRGDLPFLPGLALEAGHRNYNAGIKGENFLRITYNVAEIYRDTPTKPFFSQNAYKLSSMKDKRYDKVRRENLIYKQKKATGRVTVSGF
jgi:adhesin/invasin